MSLKQLNGIINTEMLQGAIEKIFFLEHAELFSNEVKQIKSEQKMAPEIDSISQLDPFLDNRNILRVGEK